MGRTIVIGDIHGCFDELSDLLELARLRPNDRVIAVGDLIVKGPKNSEVLDLFSSDPRFTSVIGNHDRVIRQYWRGEPVPLTKEQRTAARELEPRREVYFEYLRKLPFTIDLGSHLVVHAGVRPGVPIEHQMAADLTEMRTMGADPERRKGVPWYEIYKGEQIVLFGHWPSREPRMAERAIGLDTGCVYGRKLTAYIVESNEFLAVPARDKYTGKKGNK